MVTVDTTIVNVALPAIQQDLRIDIVELEWTINAFLLDAALLLTGGKLADFLGRRRLLLVAGRWIFYVNLPFGVAAYAFAALVRRSKDTSADQHWTSPASPVAGKVSDTIRPRWPIAGG